MNDMSAIAIVDYPNYTVDQSGRVVNIKTGRVLKHSSVNNGYERVVLYNENGYRAHSIHRLIATHFIPNPNNYPVINHKNGIRNDNQIENLEWCTHKHNSQHARSMGKIPFGSMCKSSKLKEEDVRIIKGMISAKVENRDIASFFKVSRGTVKQIKAGIIWTHVTQYASVSEIPMLPGNKTLTKRIVKSMMTRYPSMCIREDNDGFVLIDKSGPPYGRIGDRLFNRLVKNGIISQSKDVKTEYTLADISELLEVLKTEKV